MQPSFLFFFVDALFFSTNESSPYPSLSFYNTGLGPIQDFFIFAKNDNLGAPRGIRIKESQKILMDKN